MSEMKSASKTGATGFGQLSNKELGVLQDASTALKRTLSPQDADKYLTKMENAAKKVLGIPIEEKSGDVRSQYNALREQGLSKEEAKKRLGL